MHRTDRAYQEARASRQRRAVMARRVDRAATRELRTIAHTGRTVAETVALHEALAVVTL